MIVHRIILSSSYSTGKRICLHFTDCDERFFSFILGKVKRAYGGKAVPFSIHMIVTSSKDWKSVVKADPYFSDVVEIKDVDEFVSLLQRDRYLKGVDVARYILSKGPCTHTRLEKLTYMCYADYFCQYGQRLFEDKIYAFKLGPVVESVYREYSVHSRMHPGEWIRYDDDMDDDIMHDEKNRMPIKSRILFSEDGQRKLRSIDRTLERYHMYSAEELVQLTHRERTPWSVTEKGPYQTISDDDIRRYHRYETSEW